MKILVLNCGSSSIKYQLFEMNDLSILAKGTMEKIGLKGSFLKIEKPNGDKVVFEGEIIDHQAGIEYILGVISSEKHGCIANLDEINAVGHRVVHGGELFNSSVLITDAVIKAIEQTIELAPLHNPPNLKGIQAVSSVMPKIPQVAVFDTAFHQTMPEHAYMYALPYSLYTKYGVRRYGFHGTSHRFVSKQACEFLGKDYNNQRIITCHLGNGASLAAIQNGESVDTSMGLTPLEGLIMGTRSGDLDLGVLTYIMDKEEIGINSANTLLNKHSGMLGISGVSSDMREISAAVAQGNKRAELAYNMYNYRVKKYIGSYAAAMGGVDIIVFTGGIGENNDFVRAGATEGLAFMGLEMDFDKNKTIKGTEAIISKSNSKVTCVVIPTNEELVIAQDTLIIVNG